MFLINSRYPLVSATSGLHNRRHPFFLSYGANFPSSLTWVILLRLGFFGQGHLYLNRVPALRYDLGCLALVLGTNIKNRFGFLLMSKGLRIKEHQFFGFHGPQVSIELLIRSYSASPHNETPQNYLLQTSFDALSNPRRQKHDACCHTYLYSAGILTCFPFGSSELP